PTVVAPDHKAGPPTALLARRQVLAATGLYSRDYTLAINRKDLENRGQGPGAGGQGKRTEKFVLGTIADGSEIRDRPPAPDPRPLFPYFRIAAMRMRATSGRENSRGGSWPPASSSRTLVPESVTCSAESCGQVLFDAIASQRRQ